MKNYISGALLFIIIIFNSCQQKNKLIGKWYNDKNWFEFISDTTYNTGIDNITFLKNLKYTYDKKTNELTMYTDKKEMTYYLKATFLHIDTVEFRNSMNGGKTGIKYYHIK
jgi:hypothetical protein